MKNTSVPYASLELDQTGPCRASHVIKTNMLTGMASSVCRAPMAKQPKTEPAARPDAEQDNITSYWMVFLVQGAVSTALPATIP